ESSVKSMVNQNRKYNKKAIIAVFFGILSLVVTNVRFLGMAVGSIGLGLVLVGAIEISREKQKGIPFVILAIILNSIGTVLPAIVFRWDYIKWMYPDIL